MRSKSNVLLYNITAVVIGLVISGLLLLFMKVNPLDVCGQALGKIITDQYNLGEILVKATPLIFTSLAFAFTYNANLFNIGAQGQFAMGAIIAVALSLGLQDSLPTWLLLLLVLLIVIWAKKLRPQSRYGSRRNKNKGFRNYRGRRR